MDYTIIIYVLFGILPSLMWLFYYLRKDLHPEPKRMILSIFLWGALITLPVFFIQIGLKTLLDQFQLSLIVFEIIYWFLIISLSEEFFKYLVVKLKVMGNACLDEPLDIMLYMVVAALGFTAIENILYLFAPGANMSFDELISRTLIISLIRFVGATFLHTLCSAVIGYAIAISCMDQKNRLIEVGFGATVAVALHGLYDFSIMTLQGPVRFIIPAVILITLAYFVFTGFERLKKIKSITKLNIETNKQ